MSQKVYLDLLEKHRKEINEFPIAYAFNKQQLEEALEKLGVKSTDECVTIMGSGDIVKKENAKPFLDMLERHVKEVQALLEDPEVAYSAFLYEMDNHEYAINYDGDGDVLGCFGLEEEDLKEKNLVGPYMLARRKHMQNAQNWGMI